MGTVCQVSPILSQHQLSLIEGRKKNKLHTEKTLDLNPVRQKDQTTFFHCPTLASAVSSVSYSYLTGVAPKMVVCFYSPFVSRRNAVYPEMLFCITNTRQWLYLRLETAEPVYPSKYMFM